MATAPLVLGLPGDLIDQTENVDHTATKAGGPPFLPGRCDAAALPELKCGVCGKLLSLVFQAYAPLEASVAVRPLNDRVIYVFGCIAEGCGVQPGCWRALRLQEAAKDGADVVPNAVETTPGNAASIPAEETPPLPNDDWGTGAGDWGMGRGGAAGADWGMGGNGWGLSGGDAGAQDDPFSSVAAGPFSFGDLDAALDNLAVSSAAAAAAEPCVTKSKEAALKEAHGPSGTSQDDSSGANHVAGRLGGRNLASGCCGAELPEFHIYAGEEHREDRHLGAVPKEHAEKLLAQYQEDGELMPEAAIIGAAEGCSGGECAAQQQQQSESWVGEEYEEDHTAAIDATGMKFLQRLQRSPQQCARYSFGGSVMWPSASRPAPEPCGACGGPRAFELQLMGPLVHFLEEAGEWLRDGPHGSQAAAPPSSWCWATVAVYSCAGSCGGASSPGSPYDVTEEWVAVIND